MSDRVGIKEYENYSVFYFAKRQLNFASVEHLYFPTENCLTNICLELQINHEILCDYLQALPTCQEL